MEALPKVQIRIDNLRAYLLETEADIARVTGSIKHYEKFSIEWVQCFVVLNELYETRLKVIGALADLSKELPALILSG